MDKEKNNYLDIYATGAEIKKVLEEMVKALTFNVEENNNKFFALKVNSNEVFDDPLNSVSIELLDIPENIKTLDGEYGQLIINDGFNWGEGSQLYTSNFLTGDIEDGNYEEVRLGLDLITDNSTKKRLVLSGNAKSIPAMNSNGTTEENIKINDELTFKMVLANNSKMNFKDWSKATFSGKSNVLFTDNSLVVLDNDTRFTMHDNAKMDITGETEVFIHDSTKIHIDGEEEFASNVLIHGPATFNMSGSSWSIKTVAYKLSYSDIGGKPDPDLTIEEIMNHPLTTIQIISSGYDSIEEILADGYKLDEIGELNKYSSYYYIRVNYGKKQKLSGNNIYLPDIKEPTFEMKDKGYLGILDSAALHVAGSSLMTLDSNSRFMMADAAQVMLRGGSQIYMNNSASLVLEGVSGLNMRGSAGIHMNAGGQIVFNCTDDYQYSPYFIADPNGITFSGQGSEGVDQNGFASSLLITPDDLKLENINASDNNPFITIKDSSTLMVTPEKNGINYINISAAQDKIVQLYFLGNVFNQMTGNSHSEIHDNSKFIMRGPLNGLTPWQDGIRNGHNNEDWIRPIKPNNSPVFGMYDTSQFIMRGIWNIDPETKPEDWDENIKKIDGQPLMEIIENAEVRITGESVFKMTDFIIEATSEGISFSDGTEDNTVSFSISELKELKKFLSNTDIID